MDLITGAEVTVSRTVAVPIDRMWELVTAIERYGEWSPETVGGHWLDDAREPAVWARFAGHNRFPSGFESRVTCVVIAAERPAAFAWVVPDEAGVVGSTWRYELRAGHQPGTTVVRHSFTHGPGVTGARVEGETDPRTFEERLITILRNMTTTINAMTTSDNRIGAVR
ncbi:SRPBCC family protein [Solwaraspora sp. WMMD1047]|uniref:SRPBCC family protein n=1 Tax=Solwaraspora sp. WMMD1047 TaxID=3016102 RepID=UPI002417C7FF|nr:SRPBCC family protein [Solwaraspora sp. WMMD1047]MDG4833795.1 SRPBCC family protein [Solwaraspora sp. WMMD1047]